jgi:predicted nuclease with TOPRIM domain
MIITLLCESLQKRQNKKLVLRYYENQKYLQECHDEDEQMLKQNHEEQMEQTEVQDKRNQVTSDNFKAYKILRNYLL